MASASTSSLSIASPPPPSPPQKRLSKILSGGSRRSSEAHSDNSSGGLRNSLDSLSLDKLPSLSGGHSPSRGEDGRTKSGSSGVRKLIPGHAKRERKRVRDEELKIAEEEASRGRSRQPSSEYDTNHNAVASEISVSRVPMSGSTSSLVTEDSDIEAPPPLTTRDSHTGYLTTSSPLIKSSSISDPNDPPPSLPKSTTGPHGASLEQFPSIVEPVQDRSPSPRSPAVLASSPVPSFTGLVDKADTLRPHSISDHKRAKSPSRRFKDVFSRTTKSARTSPERADASLGLLDAHDLRKTSTSFGERRSSQNPEQRTPSPLRAQTLSSVPSLAAPKSALPVLQTDPPKTPPSAVFGAPETTVTPPTPTDNMNRKSMPPAPPAAKPEPEDKTPTDESSNVVVSPSGNMISHRRVRSASSTHQKSKLSVSQLPPLTPTIEEIKSSSNTTGSPTSRNISTGAGFFSSWVSAAQNAASTITALTGPNRSRSGTGASDSSNRTKVNTEPKQEEPENTEPPEEKADSPKKQLAVETLGAGSLNLAQLGIDNVAAAQISSSGRPPATDSASEKEQVAAKIEDMLAKRAVSQAYERPGKQTDATPVAEIPDPLASTAKSPSIYEGATTGTLTPPNGSIFEGHTGPIQRSNSVRSKLHNRRSRGSSAATGQSVLGAMIGASTATLANPAGGGPRLSGFAMAPKQRNRTFHQQFRSVPEDDFLIEDYSCALQKDILLAGRLYISEGHICFSSNILGWVTTLIISFEEVVSVEKENTAIVIPNAIAIQTLHARHTFRSLLSREATYDLMIGIWRVSHPDSFNKSMNHKQLAAVDESKAEDALANGNSGSGEISEEDSDEDSHSGGSSGSARSLGSSGSIAGSEFLDSKPLSRKPSGFANSAPVASVGATAAPAVETTAAAAPVAGATDVAQDFPGPATHAPTECTCKGTHYDKVIKDEIIPGPLGKVYSLLYGPQSGAFCRKFLEDGISKAQDLQLEDDKKGLDNDNKTRQYRYIKPLGGSIGPKQTNCITTEALDFFDLDKAVTVTCSTQTPDVPSGSAFVVKTRYCLTWAPNNQTRFQMNMTIEWNAKSWLKSPIEKGALDGQTQYGDDLVKTLKGTLGRTRAATAGSKTAGKGSKKRKKSSKKDKSDEKSSDSSKSEENWGLFEFARPVVDPIIAPLKPVLRTEILLTFLTIMVLWTWIRPGPSSTSLSAASHLDRLAYYNDLWTREDSDLWEWLEDRAGIDSVVIQGSLHDRLANPKEQKEREKQRKRLLKSKDVAARMREEKKSIKEMEEAVRITQERLDAVRAGLEKERARS